MSVNKAILVGHVGQDPEIRTLNNDIKVANFSLATTERGYKTKNGTEGEVWRLCQRSISAKALKSM